MHSSEHFFFSSCISLELGESRRLLTSLSRKQKDTRVCGVEDRNLMHLLDLLAFEHQYYLQQSSRCDIGRLAYSDGVLP